MTTFNSSKGLKIIMFIRTVLVEKYIWVLPQRLIRVSNLRFFTLTV